MPVGRFGFTNLARPVVEVGISAANVAILGAHWDVDLWDDPAALWGGVVPQWTDISCNVVSVDLTIGRSRNVDRFPPARGDVVATNDDGWADMFPTPSESQRLRPGRQLRTGVFLNGVTHWLYRGWIDEIEPRYTPEDGHTVILRSVDALGEVGRSELVASAAGVGAGDTADERVERILDTYEWPPEKRVIAPSGVALIASTLGGQVADLLGQAADSAGGAIYGDAEGNLVFKNRDWQGYLDGAPVDARIGNDPDGLAAYMDIGTEDDFVILTEAADSFVTEQIPMFVEPYVCPTGVTRTFNRSGFCTRVILDRQLPPGATPVDARQYDDVDNQVRYGIEPLVRTDLWTELDAQVDLIGERILYVRGADTMPRIEAINFSAATDDNVVEMLATLDVHKPSRYLCRLELDHGVVFEEQHFATGVRHHWTFNEWTAQVTLDLATPYAEETTAARWDVDLWDVGVWAA